MRVTPPGFPPRPARSLRRSRREFPSALPEAQQLNLPAAVNAAIGEVGWTPSGRESAPPAKNRPKMPVRRKDRWIPARPAGGFLVTRRFQLSSAESPKRRTSGNRLPLTGWRGVQQRLRRGQSGSRFAGIARVPFESRFPRRREKLPSASIVSVGERKSALLRDSIETHLLPHAERSSGKHNAEQKGYRHRIQM